MRAIVKTKMAPGAELLDIPIPMPKPDEVLVKMKAVSICGTDVHIYEWDSAAQMYIKNVPQIMGHEFAGEIVEVGKKVKKFRVGDYVSAETHIFCGKCLQCKNNQKNICEKGEIFGLTCDGCFAEYAAIPEIIIWKNNPQLPPEIATLQEPLGNAIYCSLANDKNLNGKKVLIIGDGPIGLLATGVCYAEGAETVVLVGLEEERLKIARRMGAFTLNGENPNATKILLDFTNKRKFDVALEMAGNAKASAMALNMVRNGGRMSAFGIYGGPFFIENYGNFVRSGIEIQAISGRRIWQTWKETRRLLESGLLDITPIITHKLPLAEFQKGFDLMIKRPKVSGKVILLP
ncbi:MAG: alcohol dehydrogenase catalytic domain-containing protein [Candidatus Nealsonbacteria bacterium]|nr:alcohol dehydrogenase catalytic domain-containing protein [Candidatus Nealsonbacteria bacterium]